MTKLKQIAKEFIDHIDSKDAEQRIDHSSFESCAIGEFSHYSDHCIEDVEECCHFIELSPPLSHPYGLDTLYKVLGKQAKVELNNDLPTYGDLQDFIKNKVDMSSLEG